MKYVVFVEAEAEVHVEVVRRGLADRGAHDLDDPEEQGDFRHLVQHASGRMTGPVPHGVWELMPSDAAERTWRYLTAGSSSTKHPPAPARAATSPPQERASRRDSGSPRPAPPASLSPRTPGSNARSPSAGSRPGPSSRTARHAPDRRRRQVEPRRSARACRRALSTSADSARRTTSGAPSGVGQVARRARPARRRIRARAPRDRPPRRPGRAPGGRSPSSVSIVPSSRSAPATTARRASWLVLGPGTPGGRARRARAGRRSACGARARPRWRSAARGGATRRCGRAARRASPRGR